MLKCHLIYSNYQSHGGKFACCYCEGTIENEDTMRTFGNMSAWYRKYEEDNKPEKDMKHYKNVISPCLLDEPSDKLVIDAIPPPELHLFEHIVTKVTDVLMTDQTIESFLTKKTVTRHGYNGGGYDGPNCQKILSSLDDMTTIASLDLIPCIEALRKFRKGNNLTKC